jgi:hypothetical protein
MTSLRQIAANRRNAATSTGPRTEEGKHRSRRNAIRHGLTAETTIGTLEDAGDYQAFETAVIADYDAQSAVERELVLRLASLLWRLRRATSIESGLFEIQAEHLRESVPQQILYPTLSERSSQLDHQAQTLVPGEIKWCRARDNLSRDLANSFLRLADLPNGALDRLSRYEAVLWRQVRQTLVSLNALDRRKPQERGGVSAKAIRRATLSF